LGNPYAYVGNNPWSRLDPYGEWWWDLDYIEKGAGSLVGAYGAGAAGDAWGLAAGGAGLGLKGFFWTGPKEAVGGVYGIVRHPIQTGQGVWAFGGAIYDDPGAVVGAVWSDIKTIPDDPERIGAIGFDIAASVATGGAAKAAYARKAGKVADVADDVADVAKILDDVPVPTKAVPNPYGKLGGPAHRAKVDEIAADIKSRGLRPRKEVPVKTVDGEKQTRYMDVVARDPETGGIVEVHQVGKTLKTRPKVPIARERDALRDVRHSPELRGSKRYYHEY
jgi:hypothetical protein